jgi:voltage-gated potassium channel
MDIFTKDIGLNVRMEQVKVGAGSELVSKSLKDMQLRRDLGVIVLAIRKADGAMQFNPPADAIVSAGDFLIVMGETASLRRLEQLVAGVHA